MRINKCIGDLKSVVQMCKLKINIAIQMEGGLFINPSFN